MSAALVGNMISRNSFENFNSLEKCFCCQWLVTAQKLQTIIIFWLSNQVSVARVGAIFLSREEVEASSDCSRLRNNLCLCLLVWPAQAVLERCPKSSAIDFAAKAFYCLLEYPLELIARWSAGVLTWNQTWTLQPDQQVVMALSAPKNPNKPCGIRILLRSVENAEMK